MVRLITVMYADVGMFELGAQLEKGSDASLHLVEVELTRSIDKNCL